MAKKLKKVLENVRRKVKHLTQVYNYAFPETEDGALRERCRSDGSWSDHRNKVL